MDFLMQLLTGLVENQHGSQWGVILMLSGAVFILALAFMLLFYDFFDPVRSRLKRELNTDAISMVETNGKYRKNFVNIIMYLFLPISLYYKEPLRVFIMQGFMEGTVYCIIMQYECC